MDKKQMSMKRSFTGPFWLMLVMGLLMLLTVSWYLRGIASLNGFTRLSLWRLLLLPTVVLAEALVYWLIRRRNQFHALSWAHSGIFFFSFALNVLFMGFRTLHYRYQSGAEGRVSRQIGMHEQIYLSWALVILAHLAFAAVLVNCFRKIPPAERRVEGGENLLDDIVL